MQDANRLTEDQTLVIQPGDSEMKLSLSQLGFEPIPSFPQLLYRVIAKHQLHPVFQHIYTTTSPTSQAHTRFVLLKTSASVSTDPASLTPQYLLAALLRAQPLSMATQVLGDAWFLHVLLQQQLFCAYQPIFELNSGSVIAHECLARARNEQGQLYSGQQLINAAIATNLTYEFDQLARSTSISSIAPSAVTNPNQLFFINVLPNALTQNPLAFEQNCEQVAALGIRPQQIVWELTEIEVLASKPQLIQLIGRIQQQGFGIAIDDLGSSSATVDHYMMEIHPNFLKLDRKLMHGCNHHTLRQVLIQSLLESAHKMGIRVVAEGLEDPEDIQFCRNLGIDLAQGFGLAKPSTTLLAV